MSLFHASTCFEHQVLIVRRPKLYYTTSGIITLKQVSGPIGGRPVHRLTEDSLNLCTHKFYYYVFILIELHFSNFSYFSNFKPLTCFSVMIPETL